MKRFAMAGAGRLGRALAEALQAAGYTLAASLPSRRSAPPDRGRLATADMLFLCVPESQIASLATRLAGGAELSGRVVFHTANSLTSAVLQPLRERGAAVASFSPLQTFAGAEPGAGLFRGTVFLLEGDPPACRLAEQVAADLGARTLPVAAADKLDIHIAAVFAANFLPALLHVAERRLQRTSIRPGLEILFPLLERTVANIEQHGLRAALSGPLQRGESGVVGRHRRRLRGDEKALYDLLSRELKRLLERK